MQFRPAQQQNAAIALIPVALISAHSNLEAQADTLRVQGYFEKPIDLAALFRVIGSCCC